MPRGSGAFSPLTTPSEWEFFTKASFTSRLSDDKFKDLFLTIFAQSEFLEMERGVSGADRIAIRLPYCAKKDTIRHKLDSNGILKMVMVYGKKGYVKRNSTVSFNDPDIRSMMENLAEDTTQLDDCAICNTSFADGECFGLEVCKHVFHAKCLADYVKRRGSSPGQDQRCPSCRAIFQTSQYVDCTWRQDVVIEGATFKFIEETPETQVI